MFEQARWKLTAWYVAIMMGITLLFSVAFYQLATQELRRVINRFEVMERRTPPPVATLPYLPPNPIEVMAAAQQRLQIILLVVNGSILVLVGGAAYFLAGRTLRPIQLMVEQQNQFVADASHELRTPLAVLRAELEGSLLEKRITEKQARQLATSNLEEVISLQKLTDNLLRLTRYDVDHTPLSREEVPLRELVLAVEKKLNKLAQAKKITFRNKLSVVSVRGCPAELSEVLAVIFDNAIKYSPAQTKISVTLRTNDHHAVVTIADQGIGVTAADLPHIFERFYRADRSRSQTAGFGLGLAIARQLVAAHQGTITAQSKPGRGTTFTIRLPLSNS